MKTLLLDQTNWDLVADASRNIAVASDPYSQAQDAASAIRLFSGELYYDTTQGVPYWDRPPQTMNKGRILGFAPPVNYMRSKFITAAMTVPGVTLARCFIASIVSRLVKGQVQITNENGETSAVSF
jgi:hypothetical protein